MPDLRKPHKPDPVPSLPQGLEVSGEEWAQAWIAVLAFGLRVTGSLAQAENVRQEAFVRLLATRVWDRGKPFVDHMLSTALGLLKNEQRARLRRQRYEAEGGAEYARDRGEAIPSAEEDNLEHAERMNSQERAVKVLAELRLRLADYPLELRLIDHAEQTEARGEKFETPSELAKIMKVRVLEVYRAMERIRRHKASVLAAVDEQLRSAGNAKT